MALANVTVTVTDANVTVDNSLTNVTVSATNTNVIVGNATVVSNVDIYTALSVSNVSGFGNLSFDNSVSSNGVFQYVGVSTSDIRSTLSNTLPITYNSSTGVIGFDANLDDLTLKKYQETIVNNGLASGNISADISAGTVHAFTVQGDITGITLSNISTGGSATLKLTQDGAGGNNLDTTTYASNWTNWKFINQYTQLSTAPTETSFINILYDGTTYWAAVVVESALTIPNSDLANSNVIINGDTFVLGSSGNLTNFGGLTTDNLPEGNTNLYYTTTRFNNAFDTRLATKSTTNLSEGVNLYFTAARARSNISVNDTGGFGSLSYDSGTGVITFLGTSLNDVRTSISGTTPIDYNSTTGVFSWNANATVGSLNIPVGKGVYWNDGFSPNNSNAYILADAGGGIYQQWNGKTITEYRGQVLGNIVAANAYTITDFVGDTKIRGPYFNDYVTYDTGAFNQNASLTDFDIQTPYLSVDNHAIIGGNLTVGGNVEITGNINYREVTDLLVQDQSITLNYGNASAQDAFIYVDRNGAGANASIRWDEANVKWVFPNNTSFSSNLTANNLDVTATTTLSTTNINGILSVYNDLNSNANITTTSNINAAGGTLTGAVTSSGDITTTADIIAGGYIRTTNAFGAGSISKNVSGWYSYGAGGVGADVLYFAQDQEPNWQDGERIVITGGSGAEQVLSNGSITPNNVYYVKRNAYEEPNQHYWSLYTDALLSNVVNSGSGSDISSNLVVTFNTLQVMVGENQDYKIAATDLYVNQNLTVGSPVNGERDGSLTLRGTAEFLSSNTSQDALTLTIGATDIGGGAGSDQGPDLVLNRISPTPAINDKIGVIRFDGTEIAGKTQVEYAKVYASIEDQTNATQYTGQLNFNIAKDGSAIDVMQIKDGNLYVNNNYGIVSNNSIYTTANITGGYIFAGNDPANEGIFIGDINGAILVEVWNASGNTLNKGDIVALNGGNHGDTPDVVLADSGNASLMPGFGVVKNDIPDGEPGEAVISGKMNFNGHGFTIGAQLYVDGTGTFTETRPTGEGNLVQKIATVTNSNTINVAGAGRTNDIYNVDEGKIIIGSTSNVGITVPLDALTYNVSTTKGLVGANQDFTAGATYWTGNSITTGGFTFSTDADALVYDSTDVTHPRTRPTIPDGTKITISGGSGDEVKLANGSVSADNTYYVKNSTEFGSYNIFYLYSDAELTTPIQTGNAYTYPSQLNVNWTAFEVQSDGTSVDVHSNLNVVGNVVATYLHGDGSNITGGYGNADVLNYLSSGAYSGDISIGDNLYTTGDQSATENMFAGYARNRATAFYGSAGWGLGQDYIQLAVSANVNLPNGTKVWISSIPPAEIANAFNSKAYWVGLETGEAYPLYEDAGLTTPSVSGLGNDMSTQYDVYTESAVANAGNVFVKDNVYASYLYGDGSNITGIAGSANAWGTFVVSGQSNVVADTNSDSVEFIAGTGMTITTDAANDTITFNSTGGAGGNAFGIVSVAGQSNVTADASTDQITFVAGSGMTLTTNAVTSEVTFTSTGGAGGNAFGIISVAGQSNVEADASTDQVTFVAGSGMTLTTDAGNDTITFTSTSSYSNTDVQTWLASGNNAGNIATSGNLIISGSSGNVVQGVNNYFGNANTGNYDQIEFSPDPGLSNGDPILFASTTNPNLTFLNGNVYYAKVEGGGFYGLFNDAPLTSSLQSGLGSESPTGLTGEFTGVSDISATVAGTLSVTGVTSLATNGGNTTLGGNITTGSTGGVYVGTRGINAIGGGTITINSVRVTDFKANDPLALQTYANTAVSGVSGFAGSLIFVNPNNLGGNFANGQVAFYDGTNWRFIHDGSTVS